MGKTKQQPEPAQYVPNYKVKCIVCGKTPTIRIQPLILGRSAFNTEMCGPCTWGEADTIDPENW